ncbi:MAG: PDZ domain-containing protein, partial [Caldilineae bacterium]
MLSTIVAFILLLGVLMFFHELGHYLAARRSGIEVEEFGVWGFPPRLVKLFTYDGTIFSINAIPLGAFVRMKGEDAADMSPGSFNAASAGARAFTLIAGPAMNLLLAVLFSVAGMMSGVPADVARPQVDAVPPGGVAAQVGVEPGDILLRAAGEPVYVAAATGDFLRLAELGEGDATGPSSGVEVIRKGTRITLAEAQDVTPQALLAETSYTPVLTTQITFVVEETPAAAAGLLPGDMVYAVNGERVTPERTLSDLVQEHLGETVTLTVLRGDEWMQVDVLARENPPPGQGAMGVGISGVVRLVSLPLGEAIWEGVAQITTYIYSVLALPVML